MSFIPYKNPLGYKNLLTWKQANEIFELTEEFVATLPKFHPKTGQKMMDMADHMLRSGRSIVRNIEEGWKRTTTKEYKEFLGFSAGSNEELLGDYDYCLKGNLGDQERVEKGLKLCKGESTMLHRQVLSLEEKMLKERTASQSDLVKKAWNKAEEDERKFWQKARSDFPDIKIPEKFR